MNPQTTASSGANGHSTVHDIFVLSDEQILEIDPDPQDVEVSSPATQDPLSVIPSEAKNLSSGDPQQGRTKRDSSSPSALPNDGGTGNAAANGAPATAAATTPASTNATPQLFSSPEDVRVLADLYPGGLTQAKSAADRARTLDEIDAAYFGASGHSPEQVSAARAQLAQRMLSENPAAFREMVFAGLRALEGANGSPPARSVADALDSAVGTRLASPAANAASVSTGGASPSPTPFGQSAAQNANTRPPEHLAAYAAFEQAANADLEKSVGGAIDRALHQALPNLKSERGGNVGAGLSASPSSGGEQAASSLQARLSQAIREDVERALQGDRQLGEQVAQILSARRLDDVTRAQVVRLINDRAQQLVPGAARRALNDWTQATLAAHRSRTVHGDVASSRREITTAAPVPGGFGASNAPVAHPFRGEAPTKSAAQTPRADAHAAGKNRLNYRKLSDEQILDL